jgi:hypothetical protein
MYKHEKPNQLPGSELRKIVRDPQGKSDIENPYISTNVYLVTECDRPSANAQMTFGSLFTIKLF